VALGGFETGTLAAALLAHAYTIVAHWANKKAEIVFSFDGDLNLE